MPRSHQQYGGWSPGRFIRWAEKMGLQPCKPLPPRCPRAIIHSKATVPTWTILRLSQCPPYGDNRSTIVTSQLPLDQWHHIIGDPTLVDAILDRLVHSAYKNI
jgi:hypothetical protein